MTDCAEIPSLVERVADGEATAAEKRAAESHLEECSSCRSHLEFLVSLSREARSMSLPEPPESYWEHLPRRVLERIETESAQASRGRFWTVLLAPSMLRWGALGATLLILVTVGVALLREDPRTLTPPPVAATEEYEAAAPVAAAPSAPPPMARDEAAPGPAKLESDVGSGEGAVSEALPVAVPSESAGIVEENEVIEAQNQPELRKEDARGLESAYRPRAAPVPAALSRVAAPESCDALRRTVAEIGDGPERSDARYRLATCSLERHESEPTEELRKLAIEDTEAFLAVEGEGPRAYEIRKRLDRVRN